MIFDTARLPLISERSATQTITQNHRDCPGAGAFSLGDMDASSFPSYFPVQHCNWSN
jgi:hypothetical protein